MSQIYSTASSVLIWLGRSGEDASAAMQMQDNFAGPIYDLFASGTLTSSNLRAHNPDDPKYWTTYNIQIIQPKVWFTWNQFFRRAWFYRRWTLQEQTLARQLNVWCGKYHLNWKKLDFMGWYFSGSLWRAYTRRFLAVSFHEAAFLPRIFVQDARANLAKWKANSVAFFGTFNTGTILSEILHRSSLLQCSSPRDMIYALLGVIDSMSRTADLFDISSNYDINVVDLYVSVFKICIENIPGLVTLSMVPDRKNRITEGLPSWVPDLAALAGLKFQKCLGLESTPYNTAFMSPRVPISRSVEGNVLDLRGFHLGDINACSLDLSGFTLEYTTGVLISLLDVCLALPTILRDGQDRIQGLWRTMVADSEYSLRPTPRELGACFHDWILKNLFIIRKYEVEWASVLSIIFEKITQLSENTVTLISLPNVGVGSLWRGRVMVTREGSYHVRASQSCN
jgi:hypothetical protein